MKKKKVRQHSESYLRKKEYVTDIAKEFFMWVVVTALAFAYWMAVFLVLSLVLLNVWHVRFEQLLRYSAVLTAIISVIYLGKILRRRFH